MRKKFTEEEKQEIIRLRKLGWSMSKIGAKLDRDHTSILYVLQKSGIMPERKGRKISRQREETEIRNPHTHKKPIGPKPKMYKDYLKLNEGKRFIRNEIGELIRIDGPK